MRPSYEPPRFHIPLILTPPKDHPGRALEPLEQHVAYPTPFSVVYPLVHQTAAHPRGVGRVLGLRLHLQDQGQDYDIPHDESQICR